MKSLKVSAVNSLYLIAGVAVIAGMLVFSGCAKKTEGASAVKTPGETATETPAMAPAERGKYLVTAVAGCNDCHTPHKMGPNGPELDMSRLLSGHPSDMKVPPAPKLGMPWIASVAATMTAWSGPWGTSYTANLTPDSTGLGTWDETTFILAIRNGKHIGNGRPIMPPMPWQVFKNMTDDDLKAIFAYLRTIPPVKNKVPDYQPPAGAPSAMK